MKLQPIQSVRSKEREVFRNTKPKHVAGKHNWVHSHQREKHINWDTYATMPCIIATRRNKSALLFQPIKST